MMNINNKEELKKLYNFTFYITGECPQDVFCDKEIEDCNSNNLSDCIYCWRKALDKRIKDLDEIIKNGKDL